MRRSRSLLIAASLTLVMIVWGGSFIAIKIALQSLSPMELVAARFFPSALMLLPVGWLIGRKTGRERGILWHASSPRERWLILAGGLCAVPLYHISLNTGETIIPAGIASLVIALNPACITILAALILAEKIGWRRWAGIAAALAGLVFISLTEGSTVNEPGESSPWLKLLGVIITLGAVISWGIFVTISKKLFSRSHPLVILTWVIAIGTVVSLPFAGSDWPVKVMKGSQELFLALLFLSAACTVGAFIIWFWALNQWPASRTGAFIYLVPLFALVFGRIILNEPLTLEILIGAAAVLGGVFLAGSRAIVTN